MNRGQIASAVKIDLLIIKRQLTDKFQRPQTILFRNGQTGQQHADRPHTAGSPPQNICRNGREPDFQKADQTAQNDSDNRRLQQLSQ